MDNGVIIKRGGDKVIWWIAFLLLTGSFLAVLSTLAMHEVSSVNTVLIKYFGEVLVGIVLMWIVYKIDFRFYNKLAWAGMLLAFVLVGWALVSGRTIGGQNASRWISILGFSFQPSAFAIIAVIVYTASYLDKFNRPDDRKMDWQNYILMLLLPVFIIFTMIAYANLSTGIIYLASFFVVLFLGLCPWKYILSTIGVMILSVLLFVLALKAFPEKFEKTRASTWEARIDRFFNPKDDIVSGEVSDETRQLTQAMTAVALGATSPTGPGKSIQKYFLPQADSDFLFAILVEEWSIVGGAFIVLLFALLVIRAMVQVKLTENLFGKFVIGGLVFMITFQAFVHMGVTVGLLPVTGQNLPFISSGGTSVLASCMAVGLIQSIVKHSRDVRARELMEQEIQSVSQAGEETETDEEQIERN